MSSIKKLIPTNMDMLKHIHGIISGLNKKEYNDFTFDKLLECRDNIYMVFDRPLDYGIPMFIAGIIACKRTTIDEARIPELLYYCQPYRNVYSIEFLHIFEYYEESVHTAIVQLLLETCTQDKNDAFIAVKIHRCNLKDYIKNELIRQGYNQEFYENDIYTFIKQPKVQK